MQAITRAAVAKTAQRRASAALERLADVQAAAAAADAVRATPLTVLQCVEVK